MGHEKILNDEREKKGKRKGERERGWKGGRERGREREIERHRKTFHNAIMPRKLAFFSSFVGVVTAAVTMGGGGRK